MYISFFAMEYIWYLNLISNITINLDTQKKNKFTKFACVHLWDIKKNNFKMNTWYERKRKANFGKEIDAAHKSRSQTQNKIK